MFYATSLKKTATPPNSQPQILNFPDHWKTLPTPAAKQSEVNIPEPSPTNAVRILVAEDEPVSCKVLATNLENWGYTPVVTHDGIEAMAAMRSPDAPSLAVLDWMMPELDGIEVCRRLREVNKAVYIIFLTALGSKENISHALQAGADDYLVKPFDSLELQARIHVGLRIIGLQNALTDRVNELEVLVTKTGGSNDRLELPI